MIDLATLGRVDVLRNGIPLSLPGESPGFLLLVLLSLEGPRATRPLADLLWHDHPPEKREGVLIAALERLARITGAEVIRLEGGRVAVDRAKVTVDVDRFREAVAGGRGRDALALYRGPFLDGVDLSLFPGLEAWVEETRRELAEAARAARERADAEEPPPPEGFQRVFRRMRSRRMVQVGLLYIGFAWGSLQVCNVLVERGILVDPAFLILLAFHVVGLPLVVTLTWVLEEEARERRAMHLLVVLMVLAAGSGVAWFLLARGADGLTGREAWAGLPDEMHIAVLPFETSGDDAVSRAYADGLAETLASRLSQVEGMRGSLWVVPSSEVRSIGVSTVQGARREFGVNLVVSGRVRLDADSVRVRVNLVDALGIRQISAFEMNQSLSEVGRIQEEMVNGLRDLLELELQPGERAALASGETGSSQAYGFHVQALGYLQRFEREENLAHAFALFRRSLEHDPDYVLALAGLGEAHLRRYDLTRDPGDLERGREAVERALAVDDRIAAAHVTMGLLRARRGWYDDAAEAFRRALQLEPHSAEALLGLAEAYRDLGRNADAEQAFREAVALRPGYWGGHNALGVHYSRLGDYEQAEAEFRRVVELTPDNSRGWANLGAMLFYQDRIGEAAESLARAVEIDPTDQAYSNLGTLHFYNGNYREAADAFTRALELNDRMHEVWTNLGSTLRHIPGEEERARETFLRAAEVAGSALESNPRDPDLLLHLAVTRAYLGEPDRARGLVRQALDLAPDNVGVLFRAGDIYADLGDTDEAIRWTAEALNRGYSRTLFDRMPGFESIRSDPRFLEALRVEGGSG